MPASRKAGSMVRIGFRETTWTTQPRAARPVAIRYSCCWVPPISSSSMTRATLFRIDHLEEERVKLLDGAADVVAGPDGATALEGQRLAQRSVAEDAFERLGQPARVSGRDEN